MAESGRGYNKYEYDDDSGSSQGLWIAALVVAAMVASFLFGKYVIGERLKGNTAAQAPPVPPVNSTTLGQGDPSNLAGNSTVTITTPGDATGAGTTASSALDSGMTSAAPPDPGSTTTPSTTTVTSESTDSGTRKTSSKSDSSSKTSSSSKTPTGGYDEKKPNKPFKPGQGGDSSSSSSKSSSSGDKDDVWRVQAGSYGSRDAAEKHRKELSAKGHDTYVREGKSDGKTVYRVVVGDYHDEKRARDTAGKIKRDGFDVSVEH